MHATEDVFRSGTYYSNHPNTQQKPRAAPTPMASPKTITASQNQKFFILIYLFFFGEQLFGIHSKIFFLKFS